MSDTEETAENRRLVDTITDPELDWVGPEPRGIASVLTRDTPALHTVVEERRDGLKNWEVDISHEGARICSKFDEEGFAMYEFVFKNLRFRLPFSNFAMGVFRWLRLAPSQLHSNSMAFIRAFEALYEHLHVEPTLPLFFRVFKIQRQPTKNGHDWVSLKHQSHKLFKMFIDSIRGFKERYYVVRPVTQSARDSLYQVKTLMNTDVSSRLDKHGVQMTRRVAQFPLSWTEKHFKLGTDAYLTEDDNLTVEDVAGFERLRAYVGSFTPALCVTRAGVPIRDEEGKQKIESRYVNTKTLLECKSRAEAKLLLDNMSSLQECMIKMQKSKKARNGTASITAVVGNEQQVSSGCSSHIFLVQAPGFEHGFVGCYFS
ncbi:hypothetical protein A2U01_0011751 [Trifolium medium]|uniref:Transposase (putative) gypsy type domain-containing protein n=1 Tax=Trifolium medium TaxID=97028 RepID=A0A392MVU9_9FABA|nr:hypothetical protein [Trifolium medium]